MVRKFVASPLELYRLGRTTLFTHSGVLMVTNSKFPPANGRVHDREVDTCLRRLRKHGLLSFRREGRLMRWSATDAGRALFLASRDVEGAA